MTIFRAIGGLGNQLFVLAAALAHKEATGRTVTIDTRRAARGRDFKGPHFRSSELTSLLLNEKEVPISRASASALALLDATSSAELRIKKTLGIPESSSWCHTSKQLGFDEAVFSDNKRYFRGYFQSFRYLDFLRSKGVQFNLSLRSASADFLRLHYQLNQEKRAVFHVRRGDYLSAGSILGVLSASYYRNAAAELVRQGFAGKFVLFTDMQNLKEDREIASLVRELDATFIETSELDPAEVLLLMTGADAYVTANSSFSWWAASLGKPSHVIAPYPWFRVEESPRDILHPNWKTMESSWD